jgi:hypothetical protein
MTRKVGHCSRSGSLTTCRMSPDVAVASDALIPLWQQWWRFGQYTTENEYKKCHTNLPAPEFQLPTCGGGGRWGFPETRRLENASMTNGGSTNKQWRRRMTRLPLSVGRQWRIVVCGGWGGYPGWWWLTWHWRCRGEDKRAMSHLCHHWQKRWIQQAEREGICNAANLPSSPTTHWRRHWDDRGSVAANIWNPDYP